MALYMIGFVTYGATLVFYAAVFPRLARNTPHSRKLREKYQAGEISAEEYEVEESLEKNRISNISTVRSWSRVSHPSPVLFFQDPQQHRIHRHPLPGFGSVIAFGWTPQGQQLRFGDVGEERRLGFPSPLTSSLLGSTRTGFWSVSGGVSSSLHGTVLKTLTRYPVIFQEPRPGPPIPKGSSYLTIGWKQVGY